jgi:NAD(P)-dependent dehydrogenase (short-subunit alcohol dehydrogenase family)
MPRLEGQVALVTGAASGLGRATASALADEGCDIGAFDLQAEPLAEFVGEIQAKGRRAVGLEVDVRDLAQVRTGVDAVRGSLGEIDILVNNAGKGQREDFVDVSPEVWDYMLAVNLTSVFNLSSVVVPHMLDRGAGRIINISSVAALRGGRLLGRTAYAAAKAGVIGFTKSLAFELAADGVTVNCIAPGVHATPRRANDTEAERQRLLDRVPSRTIGDPADLAQTVVFLSLPSSRYITGVVLPQDGGHSI